MTEIEFGARSDVGCVRENNEDSFRLAPEMNLFVLSDGMGGLASGEVASRLSVDYRREALRRRRGESVAAAGGRAHRRNFRNVEPAGERDPAGESARCMTPRKQKGNEGRMGATLVAARIEGERMCIAHVGDSRIYRLRGGDFEQLTRDHSFVADQMLRGRMTAEEASSSALQSVLIRAIGIEPEVDVDINEELLMDGDTVLLCSDGLTRELSDGQIAGVLSETEDAQEARRFAGRSGEAGGRRRQRHGDRGAQCAEAGGGAGADWEMVPAFRLEVEVLGHFKFQISDFKTGG